MSPDAWLLAVALGPPAQPRRRLLYRSAEHLDAAPPEVLRARPGTPFLLSGAPGAWTQALPVRNLQAWPADLPPLAALRAGYTGQQSDLPVVVASAGGWCRDAQGRPCELGRVITDDGPRWIVSYAGWRLVDLVTHTPDAARPHLSVVEGQTIFVLAPAVGA